MTFHVCKCMKQLFYGEINVNLPKLFLEVYRVIVMPSYMFHNDELRKRYSTNSLIKPIIAFFLGRGLS